jgi:hypothetical protein
MPLAAVVAVIISGGRGCWSRERDGVEPCLRDVTECGVALSDNSYHEVLKS